MYVSRNGRLGKRDVHLAFGGDDTQCKAIQLGMIRR